MPVNAPLARLPDHLPGTAPKAPIEADLARRRCFDVTPPTDALAGTQDAFQAPGLAETVERLASKVRIHALRLVGFDAERRPSNLQELFRRHHGYHLRWQRGA